MMARHIEAKLQGKAKKKIQSYVNSKWTILKMSHLD